MKRTMNRFIMGTLGFIFLCNSSACNAGYRLFPDLPSGDEVAKGTAVLLTGATAIGLAGELARNPDVAKKLGLTTGALLSLKYAGSKAMAYMRAKWAREEQKAKAKANLDMTDWDEERVKAELNDYITQRIISLFNRNKLDDIKFERLLITSEKAKEKAKILLFPSLQAKLYALYHFETFFVIDPKLTQFIEPAIKKLTRRYSDEIASNETEKNKEIIIEIFRNFYETPVGRGTSLYTITSESELQKEKNRLEQIIKSDKSTAMEYLKNKPVYEKFEKAAQAIAFKVENDGNKYMDGTVLIDLEFMAIESLINYIDYTLHPEKRTSIYSLTQEVLIEELERRNSTTKSLWEQASSWFKK